MRRLKAENGVDDDGWAAETVNKGKLSAKSRAQMMVPARAARPLYRYGNMTLEQLRELTEAKSELAVALYRQLIG